MRKDISRFICRAEFQILATCGAQDVSPQLDVEASMLYHLFGLRGFPRQRKQCLLEAHTYIVHESIYPRAQLGRLGYVFRRRDIESTTSSSEADIPKKFRSTLSASKQEFNHIAAILWQQNTYPSIVMSSTLS
jgi:hypothetical protein